MKAPRVSPVSNLTLSLAAAWDREYRLRTRSPNIAPMVPRVASLLVVTVLVPALLAAQGTTTGSIAGRITARADSGLVPLAGAVVSLADGATSASTDSGGRFILGSVPSGTWIVRVRRPGHRMAERTVQVVAGDTARLDVTLSPDAQVLAPVQTIAPGVDAELFASRPNVGTIVLGAAAMAGVPSAGEPDVVRVVQLLPGVVARNDYNTGLNVRGGEADQNLILLDGHPIYNPFHLGGVFSTFMDATVGGIELLTGAFPARYGGRLSSVLDVRSAEDARPGLHTSADVSALGATGRMSGAFGGGRGTWGLAGRRTYADAVTSVFTNTIFPYHFRDFHGHATYALPGGARLGLTAYAGRDVLDANLAEFENDTSATRAGEGQWAFNWGNRLLGATITKELGPNAHVPLLRLRLGESATLEQRFSASGFSTVLDLGEGAFSQRSSIRELRASGSIVARSYAHDVSLGYEAAASHVRYASGSSQTGTTAFDLVQTPSSGAVWIDDLWRVSPRWMVEGGLRAEALGDRTWAGLSPRMSVKYFLRPELALTAAGGRVSQVQQSLTGDGPLRYFEVWVASDSLVPVAMAWHWTAGAERRFGDVGSLKLEGYVKRYERVLDVNPSEDPARRGDEFLVAQGSSYGADLLARLQPRAGLAGWIAYTYGVSARWRDGVRWAPGQDRRHDLNVVGTWQLAKYRLGSRFGYATGNPYTRIVGEIARRTYDPSTDRWGAGAPQRLVESLGGPRNGARFPPTHRLDVDVSREYTVRGAKVAPYVSVLNALNAQNVFVYLYGYSTNPPTRRAISQFPILPSAGVRVAF